MFNKMCAGLSEALEVISDNAKLQKIFTMWADHWSMGYIGYRLEVERSTIATVLQLLGISTRRTWKYREDYELVRQLLEERGYYPSAISREAKLSTGFISAIHTALELLKDAQFVQQFREVWSPQKSLAKIRSELNRSEIWRAGNNPAIHYIAHVLELKLIPTRKEIERLISPDRVARVVDEVKGKVVALRKITCEIKMTNELK